MTKSLNNTPSHTGEGETLARQKLSGLLLGFYAKGLDHLDEYVAEISALTSKSSEEERLREALTTIADGGVPRPRKVIYRQDGQYSKHDLCAHGAVMYDDCGGCASEFARLALSPKGELKDE